MSTAFDIAFRFTIGEEGKLSLDPKDPGNWTGGVVGIGQLKGTKYGVSARAYPNLDIPNLSLVDAKSIAMANYWNKIAGDSLPPYLAFQMFDAAFNQGAFEAKRILQYCLNVKPDGVLGPVTMAALAQEDPHELNQLYTEFRIEAYKQDDNFPRYGEDWTDRANACGKAAEELI